MSKVIRLFPGKRARKGEYGQGSVTLRRWDQKWIARATLDGERVYLGIWPTDEEAWRVIAAFWDEYAQNNISGASGPTVGAFGLDCLDRREKEGDVNDIRNERSRWRTYVVGGTDKFKH